MIGPIRQFLRRRTIARRVARDDAKEGLLDTEDGRNRYLAELMDECAESSLIWLLEQALEKPGDVVECGVYRGQSLRWICKTVGDIAPERTVLALDSFEGFPPDAITSFDLSRFRGKTRLQGKFQGADDVQARLARFAGHVGANLDVMDRDAVFTMEQALERMRGLIGYGGEWTGLESYLPEGWETDPARRRSATASTFAASLELAKEGRIEIRQGDIFAPIEIRKKNE